ncbi:GatA Asp-tRNAAsn/Glu-tRNAGln amidotransferase A subunit and related amidases [Rhabdaerophilaceae bacterium]
MALFEEWVMEPCDLDACMARDLIGKKALSPVELLESCIKRIEAIDPAVNAMVALDLDRARDDARAAEHAVMQGNALGALHGLPLGVKDLEDTAGLRTTYGSVIFKDHVPEKDQLIVRSVREEGAVILGKTNTPEWGAGANTRNAVYGVTGNPFSPDKSAAGSSGGSGVALATGMVLLATGSDTGGSLRNPAAFNGIVGFRPSPGLVPSDKRALGWNPLSVLGPMARTVPDLCLLLSTMVGDDAVDPLAMTIFGQPVRSPANFVSPAPVDLSCLKVAMTPDFGFAPTERHIRDVFAKKCALFSHAFHKADIATPDCSGTDRTFEVLRSVSFMASFHERYVTTPELLGPNVRANVEEGLGYSSLDVTHALKHQTVLYQRWQAFFQDYDVILSPAVTISPRAWSELFPKTIDCVPTRSYFHWLALAYAVTTVGHPAISLPVGLDDFGMPFGLQITGPRGGDAKVLAVAAALERMLARDARTARPKPDLAKLAAMPPICQSPGFLGFD